MENIVCMKWGTKFGPEYVNRLSAMVRKNMHRPYQLTCFTENPAGIEDSVVIRPLPELNLDAKLPERGWRKLTMFQETLADLEGNALFLDLDIIIMGALDDFFDVPGDFRIIKDWNLKSYVGNSSVFRFQIGKHPDILKYWLEHGEEIRMVHRNEQAYLSCCMKKKGILQYWEPAWCKSFKRNCLRPFPFGYFQEPRHPGPDTRVLVFHGRPNPDEIVNGWHSPNFLRAARPAKWFREIWNLNLKSEENLK